MIAIPFVYFSFLAYFFYVRNKRNLDLPVFIFLIYAITGFFAVLIDFFGMRSPDTQNYTITFGASFTYCFCITIVVLPLVFSRNNLSMLSPLNIKDGMLKGFAWVSFLFAAYYITMSIPDILKVLSGDMNEMRLDNYRGLGETLWYGKMTPIARLPIMLLKFILGVPWIMMFIAFFFWVVQKMPYKYSVMLIIASLIGPVDGIMGVDRSQVAYWIISLIGIYIFFRPYLNKSQRRRCIKFGFVLIGILSVYLAALTISRFGDKSGTASVDGSSASLIDYFGQPYINFCFFYDNYSPIIYNPTTIFPFITQYLIIDGLGTGTEFQAYLSMISGYNVGVFYTFLGAVYLAMGFWVLYIYCFFLCLCASSTLRKSNRITTIHRSYMYCMFATIPLLGVFLHYYSYATNTVSAIFFLIMSSCVTESNTKKNII